MSISIYDVEVPVYVRVRAKGASKEDVTAAVGSYLADFIRSSREEIGVDDPVYGVDLLELELIPLTEGEDDVPDVYELDTPDFGSGLAM